MIPKSIFRKNDIRGLYPIELNENNAAQLGRAVASVLKAKNIAIGHDSRPSGPVLLAGLAKGITAEGTNVIDLGFCSTPLAYFASNCLDVDCSIMITASHNPLNYNGFKFILKNEVPINSKDFTKIKIASQKPIGKKESKAKGRISKVDIWADYRNHVLSFGGKLAPLKVVVDGKNCIGAVEVAKILSKTPINLVDLNCGIQKEPGSISNPLADKNQELILEVVKNKANLGAVYDFDADRIFFVDEKGEKLRSELIACLFIEYLLKIRPKSKIIYDIRSDWVVKETIKKNRGIAIPCPVGHLLVKKLMRKEKALFCGEVSGHYYFKENYYSDCASIALVLLLKILSEEKKPLSKLVEKYKKYFVSGEENFSVKENKKIISKIDKTFAGGKRIKFDGLRVDYPDWWFIVRASNNEPLLRLIVGAKRKTLLAEKKSELEKIIIK